jgi:predicted nucleic acid-binding protein
MEAPRGPEFSESWRQADAHTEATLDAAGELACGPRAADRARWEEIFRRFEILAPDREVAWRYGRTFRYLRDQGLSIGTNDLWIAATALVIEMPVVTRNDAEFRRVPELDVRSY